MQHVRPAEQATLRVSELVNLDFCYSLVEKILSFVLPVYWRDTMLRNSDDSFMHRAFWWLDCVSQR